VTRLPKTRLLASAGTLFALLLAGCGADEEAGIPARDARELTQALDELEEDFDDRMCDELPGSVADLETQVEELPASVDPELRAALGEGVARLDQLGNDCKPLPEPDPTETAPTTPTEPTEPTETEDTETEDTQTEKTETEQETETETQTETQPEPDDSAAPGEAPGRGRGRGRGLE